MVNRTSTKQEHLFELIKSMSKSEKRNFKLYATRLSGNQGAKFVSLFDCLESLGDYDEAKVLQRVPVKKEQLPNMKAHLYRQILISLRLLDVSHTVPAQLREQLDFARILYDKGLYRQSRKITDKILDVAFENNLHTFAIDVMEFGARLDAANTAHAATSKPESVSRRITVLCNKINNVNTISAVAMQLYGLYLQLGYARSRKDIDLIVQVFGPKLERYRAAELSLLEEFYLYQAMAWYGYIRHDMLGSYRYAMKWINLLNAHPDIKRANYDAYLRGYSRLLDGLYLMRSHRRFTDKLGDFEDEFETTGSVNDNARIISLNIIYTHRLNKYFYEGTFSEGTWLVREIDNYIATYYNQIDSYQRMLLYYKSACLYFGSGDYARCMDCLGRIISKRDSQVRRDLQCYARILNLLASYEAGMDDNIEYQIRSVYGFLVKMNHMQEVPREIMAFLKKTGSMYEADMKNEFRTLYDKLEPWEQHPYERRAFYYLDIMSWLKGKIEGIPVAEVIRRRFLAEKDRERKI